MRHLLLAVGVTMAILAAPAIAAAQSTIVVTPEAIDVPLGDRSVIEVTIANPGDRDLSGVIAHIDITALGEGGSVDPEDWSSTLSRTVGSIPAGGSRTVTWELQPISPGTFTLYAVALRADSPTIVVSDAVTIVVSSRRSLNPEGILPVAIGAPLVIGGLLIAQLRRTRRT